MASLVVVHYFVAPDADFHRRGWLSIARMGGAFRLGEWRFGRGALSGRHSGSAYASSSAVSRGGRRTVSSPVSASTAASSSDGPET